MNKVVLALGLALLAGQLWAQTPRAVDGQSYLDQKEYVSQSGGFSIHPPARWWASESNSNYLAKFSEPGYEAYIIIDSFKLNAPIHLDDDFIDYVGQQNSQVKKTMPGFTVMSNRAVRVNGVSAYRTEAIFQAGPNKALLSIYYVPSSTRMFMVMTICPEVTARKWDPIFTASVQTFTIK